MKKIQKKNVKMAHIDFFLDFVFFDFFWLLVLFERGRKLMKNEEKRKI